MGIRRGIATVVGVLLAAAGGSQAVSAQAAPEPVTVAVIDTGINPNHPEFDYRGATNTEDQLVGWWDFSADADGHLPRPGETWDTMFPIPYDTHGHGTATASMAVGLNKSTEKSPSAFPGARLAMAKVGSGTSGSLITGDLAEAIFWATETIGADVISMSIGYNLPWVSGGAEHQAIAEARDAGVLVVVSNGNGFLNSGIPGDPGMLKGFGDSPSALAVGASGADGVRATTDPEVVALWSPQAAARTGGYKKVTGTSFSAPFVAGFAARLIHEARAADRDLEPAALETLIKHIARDTAVPPNFEGHGVIDLDLLSGAIAHARAGTTPAGNPVNDAYDNFVRGTVTGLTKN